MNKRDRLTKLARKSMLIMSLPTLVLVTVALFLLESNLDEHADNLLGGAVGWLACTTVLSLRYMRKEGYSFAKSPRKVLGYFLNNELALRSTAL